MILTDEEEFTIVLASIRDYHQGENDIAILIVEKVCNQIFHSIDKEISTQDIYDEILECFDYYNTFVKEKKIDLRLIDDEICDLVEFYLNEIVKEIQNVK